MPIFLHAYARDVLPDLYEVTDAAPLRKHAAPVYFTPEIIKRRCAESDEALCAALSISDAETRGRLFCLYSSLFSSLFTPEDMFIIFARDLSATPRLWIDAPPPCGYGPMMPICRRRIARDAAAYLPAEKKRPSREAAVPPRCTPRAERKKHRGGAAQPEAM